MPNLPSRLEPPTAAPAQEMSDPTATALTVAPPPSALLAPHSQPTQQQLSIFSAHQNHATAFGTQSYTFSSIELALQSIIGDMISTDYDVNPSSMTQGTPAYCIHSLLFNRTLSPEQLWTFLDNILYTGTRLYEDSPLKEQLKKFYPNKESWLKYWNDRRSRYKKQLITRHFIHPPQRGIHLGSHTDLNVGYATLPSSDITRPLQVYHQNTNTNITNHQYVANTVTTKEIIEAIDRRADVTDSVVKMTEWNLTKRIEDTARKHPHSPSYYRSPDQAGRNLFPNDTQELCHTNSNYFKSKFEEANNATETDDNFKHWTTILAKKRTSEHDQFPRNVMVYHSCSMLPEAIIGNDVTRFLTQNQVLVIGKGTEEVVVFNAAEFASNKIFVKAILGALSFTCSRSVFVINESDDGEMHKCELTIRGKTAISIDQIAELMFGKIVKLVKPERGCVGIVDPEYLNMMYESSKTEEKFKRHELNDRYQSEGVDTHLQDRDGIELPHCIIKCSNPCVIVNEHIKSDTTSIFNGKALIDGSALMLAFNDERPLDHDDIVERYGRMFGKPMGFYIDTVKFGSGSTISFLINAPDAQSGSNALTCVSSCLAAVGPNVITDVTIENVHDEICPLPLSNEVFRSLVRRANDTERVELIRFTISSDLQEAMACATAPLAFVDCSFDGEGNTVFITDPRYADAFQAPLRLVLKLDRVALNIRPPPYAYLKSAIKGGRISSLDLRGQNNLIKSDEDIRGIQEILKLGDTSYDDQTMIFTITSIGTPDVKLNLVFSGVGSELKINDRLVHNVNTTGCKEDRTDMDENSNSIVIRRYFAGQVSADDAFTFTPRTSTNLGDNEKNNTAAFKAVRPMNTCAGTLLNSLIDVCKECTSPFSPTDEKCKACGVARALQGESGLSSTQELSVSDSGNVASSFGVTTDPSTKLIKQSTAKGSNVSFANPISQGCSPSDSQIKEGDRVRYKETQWIVVRKADKLARTPENQCWMIKQQETGGTRRVMAKNMKKIDD